MICPYHVLTEHYKSTTRATQRRRTPMMIVRRHPFFIIVSLLIVMFASGCGSSAQSPQSNPTSASPPTPRFNPPGNVLISDQFNNRVVEVDRTGKLVWTFRP